ncbi:hypothetical protein SAMCCGM7_pC1481 (plasmid) [Sinorhizobium americanum CCGM7]|nr:hypothetical protein SAMCCGM7_pC1481 [Sinorhizobium americanum CCGM7]
MAKSSFRQPLAEGNPRSCRYRFTGRRQERCGGYIQPSAEIDATRIIEFSSDFICIIGLGQITGLYVLSRIHSQKVLRGSLTWSTEKILTDCERSPSCPSFSIMLASPAFPVGSWVWIYSSSSLAF